MEEKITEKTFEHSEPLPMCEICPIGFETCSGCSSYSFLKKWERGEESK